jgi:hypothetical protein
MEQSDSHRADFFFPDISYLRSLLTYINTFLILVKIEKNGHFARILNVIYGYMSPLLVIIFGTFVLCVAET